jgi:hypothetical protein
MVDCSLAGENMAIWRVIQTGGWRCVALRQAPTVRKGGTNTKGYWLRGWIHSTDCARTMAFGSSGALPTPRFGPLSN